MRFNQILKHLRGRKRGEKKGLNQPATAIVSTSVAELRRRPEGAIAPPLHYGRMSVTLLKCDKIGLKIVALGLNLSPFCPRYENVINLTLPITLVIG